MSTRLHRSDPSTPTKLSPSARHSPRRLIGSIPVQLLIGLGLIAVNWPLAWWGPAPVSHYTFFPLWFGYILTVDGIIFLRIGSSPLTRSPRRFAGLFLWSIPLWWIFEAANHFLQNWQYILPREYGFWSYHLLSSLSFSIVIPAILVTADLYGTTRLRHVLSHWIHFAPSTSDLWFISLAGCIIVVATLALPHLLFPLIWIGVFFAVEPFNRLAGRPTIAAQVAAGRWSTVIMLFAAGITCGFFWEMWNYWSMPKWIYHIPYANWLALFEMPLLGYGGYLPFALEVYAMYCLFIGFLHQQDRLFRFDKLDTEKRSDIQR